jgi:outer membrane protein TolC
MGINSFKRFALLACPILFIGCASGARDPYELAPSSPYASWSPMKGNHLVSSKYCRTILPPEFETNELALSQLLDIALQNNPSTKQTWGLARAAAAEYGVSLSPFFPEVQFSSFYFRQRAGFPESGVPTATAGSPTTISAGGSSSTGITENYFTEAGPDVILSYTLFDFGQRTAASTAAREALYYADLTHNQQIQTVLQTVMSDYYNYLYQIAVEKANIANLENAEMSLDAANQKFSLGLAALGDVAQSRTQFLQSKINLTTQKQTRENAFAQLAVDLGLPANLPFKVQPLPEQVLAGPLLEDVNTLVAVAQTQRQDFLAAQSDLRSKEASLLQAQRAIYPTINSQLSTGRYWFNDGLVEPENHWTAVISLTFPIFNGYYYRNQIKTAEAKIEVSKAALMQSELTLIQNVTTSHMVVKTAALNLTDSEEYLQAAELEFKIALTSYKAGTTTILDVLKAQSSLSDARSKKADAQKNWFLSLADIAYATGSLCATPNEDTQ